MEVLILQLLPSEQLGLQTWVIIPQFIWGAAGDWTLGFWYLLNYIPRGSVFKSFQYSKCSQCGMSYSQILPVIQDCEWGRNHDHSCERVFPGVEMVTPQEQGSASREDCLNNHDSHSHPNSITVESLTSGRDKLYQKACLICLMLSLTL